MEENVLWGLFEIASASGLLQPSPPVDCQALHLTRHIRDVYKVVPPPPTKVYMRFMQIHPLSFQVTFSADPSIRGQRRALRYNPLMVFASAAGAALASIDNMPFRINALIMEHVYGSVDVFAGPIVRHLERQGLLEAYKVFGSIQILGSPVELVSSLGSGVKDFFYEPAQGLIESPEAFGKGIAKGAKSLFKHTVYGISQTAENITESVGKGIAVLSLDDDYLDERKFREATATSVGQGVMSGAQQFGEGLASGVIGVVASPYRGLRERGATGLMSGVGKGILGLVTKPIVGILDLTRKTFQGMKESSKTTETTTEPVRYPRNFSPTGSVVPYSQEDAYLQYLLRTWPPISGPQESPKERVLWKRMVGDSLMLVLTNRRVAWISPHLISHPPGFAALQEIERLSLDADQVLINTQDQVITIRCGSTIEADSILSELNAQIAFPS
eukprot:TRINITY_DN7943_c0_g1_i2.p1 TRINITY_DN7943_c0_g1~~TRINITY_DN7943_c0_g1_i2.p1  ORF type:complete len:444 (-),score=53.09 TRINITY_DN7943_c0_g1_i2:84-1415(-)